MLIWVGDRPTLSHGHPRICGHVSRWWPVSTQYHGTVHWHTAHRVSAASVPISATPQQTFITFISEILHFYSKVVGLLNNLK